MPLRKALPIIKSMKAHFNARAVEWGMAGWAVSWGLMVMLNPEMFANPSTAQQYHGLWNLVSWTGYYPPVVLGILFIIMGMTRGSALLINGFWRRTPLIRLITSAVSAFFITSLMVGVSQGEPNLASVNYFFFFLADCMSAKRATEDFLEAEERKLFYDKIHSTT